MGTSGIQVSRRWARAGRRIRWPAYLGRFGPLLGLGLAAQAVVLHMIVRTPFWGDDNANSYTTGYLRWGGKHWWPFFWASSQAQVRTFGRPIPLGVLQTYGLFDVLHSRVAYKLLLIGLTLVASALLGLVARRLGAGPATAALVGAVPAIVWQLHLLHDPLLSYVGLTQMLAIYTAASMLMLRQWLLRGGWWRAALVAALTACACLTYESGYLFALVLILVAWRVRGCTIWRAILLAWPGLVVAAGFVGLAGVLALGLSSASGYHPSHDPGLVLTAWAKIVTSGLPLIGWATSTGPRTLPSAGWRGPVETGALTALLLLPLLLAAARAKGESRLEDRRTGIALAGIAGVLILTPSLLTALAPQYQRVVLWGWGYLPMIFAGFGWAILGALGIAAVLNRLKRRPRAAFIAVGCIAVLAGGTVTVNAQENERTANYMAPVANSRSLIESSFTHGELNTVPAFSTVLWYVPDVALTTGPWVPGAFNMEAWTREFVNRPLTMKVIFPTSPSPVVCSDASGSPSRCALLRTPTFWLRTVTSGDTGFVALTEPGVTRWRQSDNTVAAMTQSGARPVVFVKDPRIAAAGGTLPFSVTDATPAEHIIPAGALTVLGRGSGWILGRLPAQPRFISTSLAVAFS